MRKYLLGAALAAGASIPAGGALAQSNPGPDWSGLYVGLNGGWSRAHSASGSPNVTVNQLTGVDSGSGPVAVPPATFPANHTSEDHDGFMGGGQVGFNAQVGGLVWGLEGDFDGLGGRNRSDDVYSLPATALTTSSTAEIQRESDARWISTLRARLGLGMGHALFYATGGAAWVNLNDRAFYTYAPTVTSAVATANPGVTYGPYFNGAESSDTHTGWTVGGGVEVLTSSNMTLGLEYRHTEVGGYYANFQTAAANSISESPRLHFHDDAVLARVNFKFSTLSHMF